MTVSQAEFSRLWSQIEPVGRRASGGYRRFAWTFHRTLLHAKPEHAQQ
jgi:hypothetical protein